jgi:peptide/nickel transport system substrate-binding protein
MIGFTRHARTLAALLIGVVATLMSAPAPAADAPRDTLHLSVFGDPHTLNALLATNADESELAGLVMEYLVDFDSSNTPVPVLATMVPTQANGGISADGKTITFHLRHGVKWHDGADFTAKDVLFTIAAIRDE